MQGDRHHALLSRLADYVRSPSLRHIRDPRNLQKLAEELVRAIDSSNVVWTKWNSQREDLAKAAAPCWVPINDLRDFLNVLPGPPLTRTDVTERLRAISDEPWAEYPKDEVEAGYLALHKSEKSQGTEMAAIIGALRAHVDNEEERLRKEREEAYQRLKEEDRLKREQRSLSGADCGWTQLDKSEVFYCRSNGARFALSGRRYALEFVPDKRSTRRWRVARNLPRSR